MNLNFCSGIACALILSAHIALVATPVYADAAKPQALTVISNAFKNGEKIPKPFTADGADISPALAWSALPANTKSIAVFCEDPDAPRGTWCHWILFNLPASTRRLDQGVAKTPKLSSGAMQGTNDFNKSGYNGPSPPPGKQHRYYFHVYALDHALKLTANAKQKDFRNAVSNGVLAEGILLGVYQR